MQISANNNITSQICLLRYPFVFSSHHLSIDQFLCFTFPPHLSLPLLSLLSSLSLYLFSFPLSLLSCLSLYLSSLLSLPLSLLSPSISPLSLSSSLVPPSIYPFFSLFNHSLSHYPSPHFCLSSLPPFP